MQILVISSIFFILLCSTITISTSHLYNLPLSLLALSDGKSDATFTRKSTDLQGQHFIETPAEKLASLSSFCEHMGIESFDVYGDFTLEKETSFLRRFEADIAQDFGKEDAVFMPSGTMAQSIALLIHSRKEHEQLTKEDEVVRLRFACHHTSHLLLWEEESHEKLAGIAAVEISTKNNIVEDDPLNVPPLGYKDVKKVFDEERANSACSTLGEDGLRTLIIELPHRELGGKRTPWKDVLDIGDLCRKEEVKYHCDGARIFEASSGYGLSLSEVADPFDTVYISFYKGLGSLSGSMLMGPKDFCDEARIWLSRFGGNLYTLLPYAVSCWRGYKKHVLGENRILSFDQKFEKMVQVVSQISSEPTINEIATFVPPIPETNMIHCYIRSSVAECLNARDRVEEICGTQIFMRIREILPDDPIFHLGYEAKFEWTMGEANGSIPDDIFLQSWKQFATQLIKNKK